MKDQHRQRRDDRPIHAIIPAGGAGTRLWPLSRRARPKFLLDLTGAGRSLLQGTVARLEPVAASISVVTGAAHLAAVADQLPGLPRENLLAEPAPRDSMAAIGLAAAVIAARHGRGAIVGSFAADHAIADEAAFVGAVRQAAALAGALMWLIGHLLGGLFGALAIFVILLAAASLMYLHSRKSSVDHSNVNDEWVENATAPRPLVPEIGELIDVEQTEESKA